MGQLKKLLAEVEDLRMELENLSADRVRLNHVNRAQRKRIKELELSVIPHVVKLNRNER